jgi:cellulose synthase/poly-beta-1,6-N-acetylglucosamine synthase-like glycosyltransferase
MCYQLIMVTSTIFLLSLSLPLSLSLSLFISLSIYIYICMCVCMLQNLFFRMFGLLTGRQIRCHAEILRRWTTRFHGWDKLFSKTLLPGSFN